MLEMIEQKGKCYEEYMDALSLCAVLQYIVYRFLQSTMFTIYFSNRYKLITMGLLLVFGGIRYIYLLIQKWMIEKENRKKFIWRCGFAWLLALPFFYVGWKHDYKFLIFLPVCCMCLYDMEARRIMKAFTFTICIILSATIICALSGTVRNLIQPYAGVRVLGAYGIINTTDFASYFTFLILTIWCVMKTKKWIVYVLFFILVIIISHFLWWITGSFTALYSGYLIAVIVLWDCLKNNVLDKKANLQKASNKINKIIIISFPLIGIIIIMLALLCKAQYPWVLQIDSLFSGRFSQTLSQVETFGIHPFGSQLETMHGYGASLVRNWSSGYGYLDVGYAMLSIRYGWIITIIVTGLWIWMTARALNAGQNRIAFAMAVLAVHAISEARVLDVNYNIFLIMPFCVMKDSGLKLNESDLREKNNWIPYAIAIPMIVGFYMTAPKILSWLRTFFSINSWNAGTQAIWSFFICSGLVFLCWGLFKTISLLCVYKNKKALVSFAVVVIMIVGGAVTVNITINRECNGWKDRLDAEKPVINLVQNAAAEPVYAAEASEMYHRTIGGFQDHIFSTEELRRSPGTIITNGSTEALGILTMGGQYVHLSQWSGLYTFDSKVLEALGERGYEAKPYYTGKHRIDLADVARFNEIKPEKANELTITKKIRVETKNAEADQFAGKYEVSFSLKLQAANQTAGGAVCTLEVMGEAGERIILQQEVTTEDFGPDGYCVKTITYEINDTPKVSYAISVPDNVQISVMGITWQRIE